MDYKSKLPSMDLYLPERQWINKYLKDRKQQ